MPRGKKPTSLPIGTIKTTAGDEYLVQEHKGDGGSGVVYRGIGQSEHAEPVVAVKFYLLPQQLSTIGTTIQSYWGTDDVDIRAYEGEREALRGFRHPGIQKVVGWGAIGDAKAKFDTHSAFIVPASNKVQFLVSKFIEGQTIGNWIREIKDGLRNAPSPERHRLRSLVINSLTDIFAALDYLHTNQKHQHADIRVDNILVDRDTQRPILIDFGYSQAFGDELVRSAPITRVPPLRLLNAPDALEPEITRLRDASSGKIEREELRKLLFPGLDLYQAGRLLLDLLDAYGMADVISQLDAELVRLVADDLRNWQTATNTTAANVLTDLRKLADGYWSGASTPQAPQLSPGKPVRQIALPKGSFLAPRVVERILETRSFRRLQRLKQLSLLDYVYPGANETRFSHSLAVYSTAVDLVAHLVRSPRFTKLFDTTHVDQLLITALLHDINHFPFLHYFQELDLAKEEGNNFFELFLGADASGDDPSISTLLRDAGLSPERIVEVLTTKYDELQDPHLQVIKSIVDSSVDVDKLAYVPGDARATGVPFGLGVDRAALLTGADILRAKSDGRPWHLCFHPRALSAVESLLLARYWNFKQIYWHHTNRAIGAMISHVLRQLAGSGALSLREYAIATLGRSEFGAITYLDDLYHAAFHQPSILRGLESRRAGLFKRFLSIRKPLSGTTSEDRRRERIIEELLKMSDRERTRVAERFSRRLGEVLPLQGNEGPIVLLDVPGRPLDADIHQVYVANISLDGTPDEFIKSPFIDTLAKEFLNLSRTIRLFVPAQARDSIGKTKLAGAASELEKLLEKCLVDPEKGSSTTSTIR